MSQASQTRSAARPWGMLVGLLVACVVTPIAALRGVAPDVIVLRASCAALVCGGTVSLLSAIVQRFLRSAS